jgi:N-acetyl-gamma-glutamylphosphate reductase
MVCLWLTCTRTHTYAGAQLALAPLLSAHGLASAPSVFGVSGYSGAGTTPSPRNDPAFLKDNLVPYSLTGHLHERYAPA